MHQKDAKTRSFSIYNTLWHDGNQWPTRLMKFNKKQQCLYKLWTAFSVFEYLEIKTVCTVHQMKTIYTLENVFFLIKTLFPEIYMYINSERTSPFLSLQTKNNTVDIELLQGFQTKPRESPDIQSAPRGFLLQTGHTA